MQLIVTSIDRTIKLYELDDEAHLLLNWSFNIYVKVYVGQKFFRYDHDLSCSSRNIFSPFVKYMLRKSRKTEDPDYIEDFLGIG